MKAQEENLILEILRLHYAPPKTNHALRFAQDDSVCCLYPTNLSAGASIQSYFQSGDYGENAFI